MRLLLIAWLLLALPTYAQPFDEQADSLRRLLKSSQPDTSRVKFLLTLGHFYVSKLSELTSDLDTALLLSRQAYALSRLLKYPKGQGLSYLTAAEAYREKKEFRKGKQCTQYAISLLTTYGSLVDQADAYMELSAYCSASDEGFSQRIRLHNRIITLLQRAGNKLKLAEALKQRGDLYQLKSKNEEALRDFRQALALYKSVGYTHLQNMYDLLGFVSSKTGDYEAGIKYGLLAMKTAETFNDSILLVNVYNRLGLTYKDLNQPEKAFLYFNKSIAVSQKQQYKNTIILLAITLSDALTIYDRLSKTGQAKEDVIINKALAHLQEVIRKRPADKDDIDCRMAVASCYIRLYGTIHHQIARTQTYRDELERMLTLNLGVDYQLYIHSVLIPYYVASKQYHKAQVYLTRNEQICDQALYGKELAINHLWWFKLDSAQANFTSAIGHYQRYEALNDSLLNNAKNQKIAQLEVQYKTREKEHNIKRLTQQSRLQQTKLQEAQTIGNLVVAGAVMLVLLLALLYNRYRLKQRSNQLLEAKQIEVNQKNQSLQQVLSEKDHLLAEKEELLIEKEWMLREIHHRVKNNLQIITSLLHSQGIYLKDQAALSAIRESQNRVHAMALIHQKLYQSDRLSAIPMADYIHEIVDYLITSFDRNDTIGKHFAIASIDLDVTLAVPLGLIINEGVTNSLKYGFPLNQRGTIRIEFDTSTTGTYQLTISDNGIGLPIDLNPSRSRTLGMSLIRGLSKQLGGSLQINSADGVQISLTFKEEKIGRQETVNA